MIRTSLGQWINPQDIQLIEVENRRSIPESFSIKVILKGLPEFIRISGQYTTFEEAQTELDNMFSTPVNKPTFSNKQLAEDIVNNIITVLSNRKGFNDSWTDCDEDTYNEIKAELISIVKKEQDSPFNPKDFGFTYDKLCHVYSNGNCELSNIEDNLWTINNDTLEYPEFTGKITSHLAGETILKALGL